VRSEEWARAREVFEAAVERPREDRDQYLDAACAGNAALRAEVSSLLAAHDRSPDFIEQPLFEAAADLLVGDSGPSLDGQVIGPYVIRHEIGRGGMGVVYLADDTRLSRRVAIKALAPSVARDPRRRERLRQEARAAAALSHPNIATVFTLDEIGGELFLVSEHVAGPTLRALLESGPIPPAQVIGIALQLARALAAAHAQGVVHRDLKPENVVRASTGVIKVLDFGVARIEGLTPANLTGAGEAPGTPGYMAPEQIRGGAADFRVDLFAFGVLVYELACGSNPFQAGSARATMARVLESNPPPLSEACHEQASVLDGIVATCLSKDPAGRYRSTLELVADLERLDGGLPARAGRSSGTAPSAVRSPRWWWEFHQGVMSALYIVMMYPVWSVRVWLDAPWGILFVLAVLSCAATSTTLRLHLLFTSRSYPSELAAERRRARIWTRVCDGALALILLAATARLGFDHQAIAVLFVTVAIGTSLAAFVIEPTTTRAAFPD
jgi:predicted Ser/Thr protein kinase